MNYFASVTINRCHLRALVDLSAQIAGRRFPFQNVIVSPLVVRNGILPIVSTHKHSCNVMFDSGGFHIQQGQFTLTEVALRIDDIYKNNPWAHRYVIPDVPIVTQDNSRAATAKIRANIRQYRSFPEITNIDRSKLVAVVHGRTTVEIARCAAAAAKSGVGMLGFGAFSTSGSKSNVNTLTGGSCILLAELSKCAHRLGLPFHVFGIGNPSAIPLLMHFGAASCDSAGWIRSAGFGNVFLPFIGAVNITGAASTRRTVGAREFSQLKRISAHDCVYCSDLATLKARWHYRALHNYEVALETISVVSKTGIEAALAKLDTLNPRLGKLSARFLDTTEPT